jgi:osmotically-inducible protein OsmY
MNRQSKDKDQSNYNQRSSQGNRYQSRLNSGYPRGERNPEQSWNGSSWDNANDQYRNSSNLSGQKYRDTSATDYDYENDLRSTQSYGRDQYDNDQYYRTGSTQPNRSERYNSGRSSLDYNSSNDLYSDRNASDRNDYISQSDRFGARNYGSRDYNANNYASDYSARDYGSRSSRDYGNENTNRSASTFDQDRSTAGNRYTSRFDEMNRTGSYNPDKFDREYGQHGGKGPKNYKRADSRIHEEVCDALAADAHIDASEIEVNVKDGIVTLTGTVSERSMKRAAEDCAEQVKGVTDVRNEITTQSSSSEFGSSIDSESKSTQTANKSKTGSSTKNFM